MVVQHNLTALGGLFLLLLSVQVATTSKQAAKEPVYKVHCSDEAMVVEMIKPHDVQAVYLEHLKNYPLESCHPIIDGDKVTFKLNLQDIYKCMVTKVLNKATGRQVYYHRIITEYQARPKQVFLVKCDNTYKRNHTEVIVKRSAQNIREPDYIEITDEIVGRAPIPELIVGVKQDGTLIDEELTVKPGTPLSMEIFLDNLSADIYGLMVSSLDVTDTIQSQESLIVNGCTVDPVLFENFLLPEGDSGDGDFLRAKFQAFKFPETNFVLFKGIVNVCLDRCNGVQCSNGQKGYGRRRRRDVDDNAELNQVYEVSMSTIVKVSDEATDRLVTNSQGRTRKTFISEEAVISEIFRPDHELANARLSESFGPRPARFIEFNHGSSWSKSPSTLILALILAVALL